MQRTKWGGVMGGYGTSGRFKTQFLSSQQCCVWQRYGRWQRIGLLPLALLQQETHNHSNEQQRNRTLVWLGMSASDLLNCHGSAQRLSICL